MSGSRARPWLALAAVSAALLAWSNMVVPSLPPADGVRTTGNLAATGLLVAAARSGGLGWRELGAHRSTWRAGARWGAAALAVTCLGYGVALAVPGLRHVVVELAGDDLAAQDVALRVLVLIPLGTVLCEEVAFRGVLLAAAGRVLPPRAALVLSAVVFGLWHAGSATPALGPGGSPASGHLSTAGVVVVTAAGGLVLGWLRQRSGSLLAPAGLHLGTNSVGLAVAAAAS